MTRTAEAADEKASAEKLEAAAAEGEVQIYKYKALHLSFVTVENDKSNLVSHLNAYFFSMYG